MDTLIWEIHSPLYGEPAREGSDAVTLAELPFRDMALVAKTASAHLTASTKEALQLDDLPIAGKSVTTAQHVWLWANPSQWLVVSLAESKQDKEADSTSSGLAAQLRQHMTGFFVSEQTSSRVNLQLSGHRSRDVLSKLCDLDLDDSVFKDGDVAITNLGHINACMQRSGDRYNIWVFSSFARSLWHDIITAGEEYDITIQRFYD